LRQGYPTTWVASQTGTGQDSRTLDVWEEAVGVLQSYHIQDDVIYLDISIGRVKPLSIAVPIDGIDMRSVSIDNLTIGERVSILRMDVGYHIHQQQPEE
jgi:hypothetical protein